MSVCTTRGRGGVPEVDGRREADFAGRDEEVQFCLCSERGLSEESWVRFRFVSRKVYSRKEKPVMHRSNRLTSLKKDRRRGGVGLRHLFSVVPV